MMRPQPGMRGRKVGVYGMGEIGRKIAARVAAFESEVGYFSRSQHDVPYRYLPSLEALAEWCSVLMIAVRAGADTHHAVDADILKKLGEDGYVVNIARGSVIDQQALVAALTDKTIAGAGLDVYAREPHAPDALTALPNVVLTPHIGGHTLESHIAMQDCVIANLEAFFAGKPCLMRSGAPDDNLGQSGRAGRRICGEFSAWQAGKDLLNNRLPDVLAVAGTSVLAFRKPDTIGDHSFQDIRMDCSKGKEAVALEGCGQGSSGLPDGLDPVQDCRRPRRNFVQYAILQRLNRMACIDG